MSSGISRAVPGTVGLMQFGAVKVYVATYISLVYLSSVFLFLGGGGGATFIISANKPVIYELSWEWLSCSYNTEKISAAQNSKYLFLILPV